MPSDSRKLRSRKLFLTVALILAAGIGYALLVRFTGFGIACPINRLTGLKCPGCGVTRMCLSLMSGDLAAAWSYNPALICAFPFLLAIGADLAYRYVKYGDKRLDPWANVLMWVLLVSLLIFGILRNIL